MKYLGNRVNLFVCLILYNVALFPLSAMFAMCSIFLVCAAFLQKKLETLSNVQSHKYVPMEQTFP